MAARSLSVFPISPSNPQSIPKSARDSPASLAWNRRPSCLASSFHGGKLSVVPPRSRQLLRRVNSTVATVLLSLPTGKPDRASTDKLPKWSARAIKSFAMAELEARKLKYPNTGTEALLMGILVEGTSLAAKFLRADGITLFKVREETVNLLGKSDMYFFSPEHPPLTEQAQRALDWAVDAKLKSGDMAEISSSQL
ncbi:hypothetical protein BT93_A2317 [Corymbia citriodora subsp. variegata]|nr:hypothetical protein BT93_A2317 [Corymbia citriodora subsp. variegata]